jgi:hypothetical protein
VPASHADPGARRPHKRALQRLCRVQADGRLIAWLLCVWMVNDSTSFRMTSDCYDKATVRFLEACGLSLVFGDVVYFLNRWVFPGALRRRGF